MGVVSWRGQTHFFYVIQILGKLARRWSVVRIVVTPGMRIEY